jgi:hypothetical protein
LGILSRMTEERKKLIASLYSGRINKGEFLQRYFNDQVIDERYPLELPRTGINHKDSDAIEEAVVLLYAGATKSYNIYANELCSLLQMPWHTKHEDIAMLLKELADPSTVDCLFKTAELQFEYLEYDDTYQFARKCIKALSSIGNENAITKLKILSNSKIKEIAEFAKSELQDKS